MASHTADSAWKEVAAMEEGTAVEWETPELEEIETRAEVTAYSGHWE